MKKYLDLIALGLVAVVITSLIRHYEVHSDIGDLLRNVALKIAPWMNNVIYS